MLSNLRLPTGIFTASLTPLDRDLNPDYPSLVKHLQWLLSRGNDGIGLLGTTGEANSFSVEERLRIAEAAVQGGVPAEKLLVGTGCCSITDTVTLTRHAHSLKVGGVLLLPPFYYKGISDEGLQQYFDRLLDKLGEKEIRIYLYHFPQLTGVPYSLKLVEKLVDKYPENIVGMKDSSYDWPNMEKTMKTIPGFRLYCGVEKFLLPVLKAGGAGTISATTNLNSPRAAELYKRWQQGAGEKEQEELSQLRDAFEGFPVIGALKSIFAKWSGLEGWSNLRPPNCIISPGETNELEKRLLQNGALNPFKKIHSTFSSS